MSNQLIHPYLFYNVPLSPSGLFDETIPTTTTPIPPLPLIPVKTPDNSGIRDFTIINPYIHYSLGQGQNQGFGGSIIINPSAYLTIAPKLFNLYNLRQRIDARNGIFIDANNYVTSPN